MADLTIEEQRSRELGDATSALIRSIRKAEGFRYQQRLEKLVEKWRKEALAQVPPEYADRDLHGKYLKLDNAAAGMDDCADELEQALKELGEG